MRSRHQQALAYASSVLLSAAAFGACSEGGGTTGAQASGSGGAVSSSAAEVGSSPSSSSSGGAQGGASGSTGTGTMYPPGPPGCGLDAAAFCETFDAPAGVATRAGELDPKKWSASRMCEIGGPSNDDHAVAIGPATVPTCRAGLPAQVFPSSDALICDGNAQIQSNHLLTLVAAQNYGQNSYRVRQPFDFANRTGKVVFDAEGHNVGLHGWISLEITEQPMQAPSFTFQQNYENGAIPENAIEIQFNNNGNADKVGVSDVIVYDHFKQTQVLSNAPDSVDAAAGKLNHFEVRLAKDHVEVYATPASEDGIHFGAPMQLASVAVSLPFTRGYVHFTAHNHATLKYSNNTVDSWPARWDNVGFDGPAITSGWREYEALDSLEVTASGKVNVGWRLADVSKGPAQAIQIKDVDLTGVTSARLSLENWALHFAGSAPPTDYALNYRINGKAWKMRSLTPSELQMMVDLPNAGTRALMLDIDLADLVPGTQTLELTTSNADMGYPPVVLDIDLVLSTN